MSRRGDLLRSLFRAGADRAAQRLEGAGPVARARRFLRQLRDQRARIDERTLTQLVAHVPGVESASVNARSGKLHVDVAFLDGESLSFSLAPHAARFAPRGAKELVLRVQPAEAARARRLREVASAIAGAVAQQLWTVALTDARPEDLIGAIVDRDGAECLRVDLRTVPAVREALRQRSGALIVELLELRELLVEDGALVVAMRLPGLLP